MSTPNITDITEFVHAFSAVAVNAPALDVQQTPSDDGSTVFVVNRRPMPPIPAVTDAQRFLNALARRDIPLRIDSHEQRRNTPNRPFHFSCYVPEGDMINYPMVGQREHFTVNTHTVRGPGFTAALPSIASEALPAFPNPTPKFRIRAPEFGSPKASRCLQYTFAPVYVLDYGQTSRARFVLRGNLPFAIIDSLDLADLQNQCNEQLQEFISRERPQWPDRRTLEQVPESTIYPADWVLWTIGQNTVHADPNPGITPIRVHSDSQHYRAAYACFLRALHHSDRFAYLPVVRNVSDLQSSKPEQFDHLHLDRISVFDHQGAETPIPFDDPDNPPQLPYAKPQRILFHGSIRHATGGRDEFQLESNLLAVNSSYFLDAAATGELAMDADTLASFLFECCYDYDNPVHECEEEELLHNTRILAVKLLQSPQEAFVAELQHISDNFSPNAPRPGEPVTVASRNHTLTWTPA